jgi:CheY-like chemotaxis protein
MPGHDLINMIKATMEWVDIPIVLYTRLEMGDDEEARQIHGADAIVAKGDGSVKALSDRVGAFLEKA